MALSTIVTDIEKIPEPLREHYKPIDAEDLSQGFTLQTDNSQEKGSIREYRNKNIEVGKQAQQLQSRLEAFGDADPDTVKRAMAALKQVEDSEEQKLLLDGKFDEVLSKRTDVMRQTFEAQYQAKEQAYKQLEQTAAGLKDQLAQVRVGEMVTAGIEKAGVKVRPGAMNLIHDQTRKKFSLDDDGNPVVKQGDKFGKNGSALTIPEYIETLVTETPFLFEGSSGGGSEGGSSGGNGRSIVIDKSDPTAFGNNIEAIAKGKMGVQVG
jgi:hypothetical protein